MKRINGRYYETRNLDVDERFDFLMTADKAVPLAEFSSLHIAEDVMRLNGVIFFIYTPIGDTVPMTIECVGAEIYPPPMDRTLLQIIYRDYELPEHDHAS